MVYGLVLVVHILVAFFLVGVILLQGGRGGLGETIGGVGSQSLFGGAANTVMTKVTSVVAGLFMVSCLFLAKLSTERGRSVIERVPLLPDATAPLPGMPTPATPPEASQPEAPAAPAEAPAPAPAGDQPSEPAAPGP